VYSPKQQSTYCNIAFELLGLVLESVTGKPYAESIDSSILKPLGMKSTSIAKPDDSVAVIPKGGYYWDVDEGVQNP
jgi:CubicO group peptidase (beta-lactamase class C family)